MRYKAFKYPLGRNTLGRILKPSNGQIEGSTDSIVENNPDIIIKLDIFTHEVGVYRAEVVAYVVSEEIGENDEVLRQQKEVYRFTDLYDWTPFKSVTKAALYRVAHWLIDQGYSGLVSVTGNAKNDIGGTAGTGITKYHTANSNLYLTHYSSWFDAQQKGCVTYYEDDDEDEEQEEYSEEEQGAAVINH